MLEKGAVLDALGAGATQAAGGFGLGHGGGEPQFHFGIRLGGPGLQAEVGHRLAGGDRSATGIHDEVGAPAGERRQFLGERLAAEGAVDDDRGPAPGGKGVTTFSGPVDQVASAKTPGITVPRGSPGPPPAGRWWRCQKPGRARKS